MWIKFFIKYQKFVNKKNITHTLTREMCDEDRDFFVN